MAVPMGFLSAEPGCKSTCAKTCKTETTADSGEQWAFLPDVVASYGKNVISKKEFVEEISKAMKVMGDQQIPPEYLKKVAPQVAQGMVEKAILLGLAEQAGVKPSSQLVISEFENMYKELPEEQKKVFSANLTQNGSSIGEYKVKLGSNVKAQEGIAIEKYVKSNILDKIQVTDNDAEKFYNEKSELFKAPERISASHILIKPEGDTQEAKAAAKVKAEKILAELKKAPESFGSLAAANSECPSGKSSEGSLGEFARGQMVPEFEEVAFKIEPNTISDLVETKFGYHIIKVTEKKESETIPYEKVKGYIKKQLTGEKVQKALKQVIDKEKERLNVKINV